MNFEIELKEKIDIVNNKLEKYINNGYPNIIYNSMRYSVFAGGKRLRPVMMLSACELFNYDKEAVLPFACALEMIHTYSLIHDDLPAMDNDDFRRGKLTSHKKFGEDIAILTGDALLHYAMEIMANECVNNCNIKTVKAMQAIAYGAGINGMLSGQVVDVISEGKKITASELEFIHKNKTAAMIIAALKSGAILGGADEYKIKEIEEVGEKIGVAFQIQDDVLDVIGEKEILGKPIGSDEKNQKVTYVTMYGIEESKKFVEKLSNEAVEILEGISEKSEFLIELTKYLIRRKN